MIYWGDSVIRIPVFKKIIYLIENQLEILLINKKNLISSFCKKEWVNLDESAEPMYMYAT